MTTRNALGICVTTAALIPRVRQQMPRITGRSREWNLGSEKSRGA